MGKLKDAISKRDYRRAARLARENIQQIPTFVRSTQHEYGSFNISSVFALEHGGTMLALAGDDKGLKEMREIVRSIPELKSWSSSVDRHEEDMRLFAAILDAVAKNPGCLQIDVKKLVGTEDGRRIANLISWLEKAERLSRTKRGRSFALAVAGSGHDTASMPKRQVKSHRTDRSPLRCREIDLQSLPYVPLPRAPLRWEERSEEPSRKPVNDASDWFEIREADQLKLLSVEKIPIEERPDPAFRQIHPINTGLIMVDDLGKSKNCGSAPAAVVRFGRDGNRAAEALLHHDVYRIGVNPLGRGLIAMSRDCVAHAYDDTLNLILETSLHDSQEILALQRRLGIDAGALKNHLRCVAIACDTSRYLFTGVDEAWCVDMAGQGLWGVKLPMKEGWSRVTEQSNNFGTSVDVMRALEIMNLAFPFTVEDFKQRYRELAKQWHPDLNPENPNAEERMKALTAAAEILTGIDQRAIPRYTGAMFMREFGREESEDGNAKLTISAAWLAGEVQAADWIYAANFAGYTHDVFLAGYSGKVIQVNGEGQPVRAYDIGAVPSRIVDTGDYLYFLTDTRLYALRGDSLVALIDTFESGDLIVAKTGFGLLEKNRFQWFREDGPCLGAIVTRNPIRRIYHTPQGMVVETRQRRAIIGGVTTWWE